MESYHSESPLAAAEVARRVERAVSSVVRGKETVVRLLVTALFSRGHVLVEDVPGVGKTTLARALAAAVGGEFRRIQFTSDLLPSDITGVSVYDPREQVFTFKRGPIFANIVLADEINRTTPRTQSSLMEVLSEAQVSVDSTTYALPEPFMVVATQNPIEHFGTYPLPESQMDRFSLRLAVGYPRGEDERIAIRERQARDPVAAIEAVTTLEEIERVQGAVEGVRVDESLTEYLMAVVQATRTSSLLALGVSTRGAISWHRSAQAAALIDGRDYCIPDDFSALALPALAHRILASDPGDYGSGHRGDVTRVLEAIVEDITVPL